MEDKEVAERIQYGFTKKESCLTSLVDFYNEAAGWVDEGSVVNVVYLDFKTAFHINCKTISQRYWWAVRWIKNLQNGQAIETGCPEGLYSLHLCRIKPLFCPCSYRSFL